MTRAASWAHAGELLYLLVIKELKVRYKSRFLGYLWALANPAFVYSIAFKFIAQYTPRASAGSPGKEPAGR
jgi:ABC-type polysaccharide/polyol phosphate export permease